MESNWLPNEAPAGPEQVVAGPEALPADRVEFDRFPAAVVPALALAEVPHVSLGVHPHQAQEEIAGVSVERLVDLAASRNV